MPPHDAGAVPDQELTALLSDPRVALRAPSPDVSLDRYRAAANKFLSRAPRPAIAIVRDLEATIDTHALALRLYAPREDAALPLVLFVHGGGFVFGNLDTHDALCRHLAIAADACVIAVDYRLAPENPFPAALNDVERALRWSLEHALELNVDAARVALAGDSAGGQLCIATALRSPDVAIRHLGLFYPLIDPAQASASQRDFGEGYMLTGAFLRWAWHAYAPSGEYHDPLLDLTRAALENLPPLTIVTAALDPLRDEGEAFAARARDAGQFVSLQRFDGMIHGFAGLPQPPAAAAKAIDFVGRSLAQVLHH